MADLDSGQPVCAVCGATDDLKRCGACKCTFYCGVEHQKQDRPTHKMLCRVRSSVRQSVIVVGGVGYFDGRDDWLVNCSLRPTLEQLDAELHVMPFSTEACMPLLQSGAVAAIVVSSLQFESAKSEEFCFQQDWLTTLHKWVSSGGMLVFMGGEGSVIDLFQNTFDRPWRHTGDFYRRTVHVRNSAAALPAATLQQMPEQYNVKACMLSGVAAAERVYAPPDNATVISGVPAPGFHGTEIQGGQCGVAAAQIGQGRLVYFGDVNGEQCSMQCLQALMRMRLSA